MRSIDALRVLSCALGTLSMLGMAGCADDSNGAMGSSETDIDSGFTEHGDSNDADSDTPTTGPSTTNPPGTDSNSETDSATETDSETENTSFDTLGEGSLRGTLTFTLYGADAANADPVLGMAGAWRSEENELEGVEDFFGVFGLGVQYPTPPLEADTLEHNAVPAAFNWGAPVHWQLAGTAMKLELDDIEATACLLYYGGEPEVFWAPKEANVPNYPMYAATPSENQPDGCVPDAGTWVPSSEYDIVLYGGEAFDTNVLEGQVHTPDAVEITSPDATTFGTPLPIDEDLEIAWSGEAGEDTRLVIRVSDMFGRMFTISAEDDGSYTIPAADLMVLTAGPATITVARENLETVPFTDGTIDVLSRYEQWAYVDLY